MTGLPTGSVLLDDGTGTFPYDISAFVRLTESSTWSRGRPDELQSVQPGAYSLTLDNTDGRFTFGNGTYNVAPDQKIRLIELLPASAAACNLIATDPSFETSGGSFNLNTGTATSDSAQAKFGSKSLKIVPGAENYGYFGPAHTIGTTYTASVWVFSTTTQLLALMDYGTSATQGPAVNVLAGVWTRLSVTFVAGTNLFLSVRDPGRVRTIDQVWIDGLMFTTGSTAYDFTTSTAQVSYIRWTGRVQSWPVSWPGGDDTFAIVQATAIDPLATMARRVLRSAYEEEVRADIGAGFYYPCSEAQGATQAADASGNAGPALVQVVTVGGNPTPTFGTSVGAVDGVSAVQIVAPPILPDTYLSGSAPASSITSVHTEVRFTASSGTSASLLAIGGLTITLTGGAILALGHTAGSSLDTGALHVVSVEAGTAGTDIWVDGVKVYTDAVSVGPFDPSTISVGQATGGLTTTYTMTFGYAQVGPRIADARVLAHHTAARLDFAGELPAARVTRVAGYAGVAVGTLDSAGDTICGQAGQSGKSALDVCNEVTDATQGIVYADKNGAISSISGYTIAASVTPALTLDANYAAEDTAVVVDMAQVNNRGTGKTNTSPNVATFANAASVLTHGDYPKDYVYNVSTDAQAVDRLTWAINNYANPDARFPTLLLDLLTLDVYNAQIAMGLDVGSFLRITGMPAQTPGSATVDLIVQGISGAQSPKDWTLALTCAKRTRFAAWVLDNTTFSVLDTSTRLYI